MKKLIVLFTLIACANAFAADNQLTPAEKRNGWLLLFDGATLFGWHAEGEARIENGVMVWATRMGKLGGAPYMDIETLANETGGEILSDKPAPRLSKVISREKDASRPSKRAATGHSHMCSICQIQVGTQSRSIGPSPTTW